MWLDLNKSPRPRRILLPRHLWKSSRFSSHAQETHTCEGTTLGTAYHAHSELICAPYFIQFSHHLTQGSISIGFVKRTAAYFSFIGTRASHLPACGEPVGVARIIMAILVSFIKLREAVTQVSDLGAEWVMLRLAWCGGVLLPSTMFV